MIATPARQIAERIGEQQALVLARVRDLPDDLLARPGGPHAPAIAFHLWHLARWADLVQAHLPTLDPTLAAALGPGEEVWARDGLAAAWGLADRDLGFLATGMGLPDVAARALPLPDRAALLDYAAQTFAAAARAAGAVDDARFVLPARDLLDRESSIGGALLNHLLHVGRHLGMIEAALGFHGQRGTATR